MYKDFLFIIQARINSSRLPNKILFSFKGKTIIEYLYCKIKKQFSKSQIVIGIPDTKKNIYLKNFLKKKKLNYCVGSEEDLISRYQKVSKKFKKKYIVRLTSDNPLINIRLVKYSLNSHLKSNQKFSSTRKMINKKIIRFFPKGHSIDIINKEELLKINTKYLSKFEKEHIIPYLYKSIKCNFIKNKKLKQNLNLKSASIDTLEDYLKII